MHDEADASHALTLRLNGHSGTLGSAGRQLVAIDRAWAFSISVEAYRRGYQETWARQTQYAPRPDGFRFTRNSPTLVDLWQTVDGPAIVGGGFAAFVWVVNNVEKIATIPDRIALARVDARVRRRELEVRLQELEQGDEPILIEPAEPPALASPGEAQEPIRLVELNREQAIHEATRDLERLERLEFVRNELDRDLDALIDRARGVQRDLERVEPEIEDQRGILNWRPRRRRAL